MWARLRPKIADLDPIRVENGVSLGTPDVNYADGWVELKQLPAWPKRPGTPVRVPHFTTEQRTFAERRWRAGGATWVLIQIVETDEWFLFDGLTASRVLHHGTEAQWRREAAWSSAAWSSIVSLGCTEGWVQLNAFLSRDQAMLTISNRCRLARLRRCISPAQMARQIGWEVDDLVAAERGNERTTELYHLVTSAE